MLDLQDRNREGSWLDGALERFDAGNDELVMKTGALLNRVVPDASLHARFINTLSMLEHMGSHKIMATQAGASIDQATLKHVAEEAHHAFFMKRQAEKAGGRSLEYVAADLLAPLAARMYFQRLEAAVVKKLRAEDDVEAAYLYMSMIVEFRAIWFYGLYQKTLKRHAHPLSLKRLLGEEQAHLGDMAARLDATGALSDDRVDAFCEAERRLYLRLLDAMHVAIN